MRPFAELAEQDLVCLTHGAHAGNEWDLHLARIGAIFMTFTILLFLAAFLLAGFVTSGMGNDGCYLDLDAKNSASHKNRQVETASSYATVGFGVLLVVLVLVLAVKG